ncbi:MAG: aminoacyl-tRNA hydrolase, partial [Armatimonadetes bacterium]|nr:aminoacyl-tRNA hydrolase [Armatimonadota bacterium]
AGTIRVRARGSHGGHNGIRSIIEELGSGEFARVKIGIGRPPEGVDPAEYVLSRFAGEERALVDEAVVRTADAVEDILGRGVDAAMNRYNRRPAKSGSEVPLAESRRAGGRGLPGKSGQPGP